MKFGMLVSKPRQHGAQEAEDTIDEDQNREIIQSEISSYQCIPRKKKVILSPIWIPSPYMNMVLDDTDENFEEKKRKLGTVILRGNNVVSITPK